MTTPPIPDDWTAREALAVYEFIDAIREQIWNRYGPQLMEILREEHSTNPEDWTDFENREDPDDELKF